MNYDNKRSSMRDYNDWDNIHLYYRSLNYSSDGKFLMSGNIAAKQAIEPASVVPGAISSASAAPTKMAIPTKKQLTTSRPIGVHEQPMFLAPAAR